LLKAKQLMVKHATNYDQKRSSTPRDSHRARFQPSDDPGALEGEVRAPISVALPTTSSLTL